MWIRVQGVRIRADHVEATVAIAVCRSGFASNFYRTVNCLLLAGF